VRLALFQEQKRVPLRRDEISKKVMGSQRGTFKAVFEEAQSILRSTFGMELVELPTRAATHDITAGGGSTTNKERAPGTTETQNTREGGDRQAITGLKKKGVYRVTDVVVVRGSSVPLALRRCVVWSDCMRVGLLQPPHKVRKRTSSVQPWMRCLSNALH
jgi:melanoma-associated antigen